MASDSAQPFDVLIAGGGVAALEGALALRELAGDRVRLRLLSPSTEFVYRPLTVQEPFAFARAQRYPLDEIARDLGIDYHQDALQSVDASGRTVTTEGGEQIPYDALLVALGAQHPTALRPGDNGRRPPARRAFPRPRAGCRGRDW